MRRTRVLLAINSINSSQLSNQNYLCVAIETANLGSIFRGGKKVGQTQARWIEDIRIFDCLIGSGANQSSFASLTLNPRYRCSSSVLVLPPRFYQGPGAEKGAVEGEGPCLCPSISLIFRFLCKEAGT